MATHPFRELWRVALSEPRSLRPVLQHDTIVSRTGGDLRAFALDGGSERWRVTVDPRRGAGAFLQAAGELVVTEQTTRPDRLSALVVVRGGKVVVTIDTGAKILEGASVVRGQTLFAIANDYERGLSWRAYDLASGAVTSAPLADAPARLVRAVDGRFLVCNIAGPPGIRWIHDDGSPGPTLEATRATELEVSDGRAIAAVRGQDDAIEARVYDLASGRAAWSVAAASPWLAIGGEDVVVFDRPDHASIRSAPTGAERWGREGPADELLGLHFVGAWLAFETDGRVELYTRDGRPLPPLVGCHGIAMLGGRVLLWGDDFLACCAPQLASA